MGFNNSAKQKEIRIAADEKDKSGASKHGIEALNKDISSMINYNAPLKNLKSAGGGLVSSDKAGPYMMGGGTWLSKRLQSKSSPHPDAPLKEVENVIDRDAKSSGPHQYDERGK